MYNYFSLVAWFFTLLITNIVTTNYTVAIEAPDGTVAFEKSPRLIDTHTTFSNIRVQQARYYFDLELPADAGESLQKVVINQRQGSDTIRFLLDKTRVYLGTHNDKQKELNFTVSQDEATKAISITLEPAILPGNKITIGLKPRSNPDFGGVYLFGVTAFPTGEKPYGLYLGAGRLQFYQNGDFLFR